MNNIHIQDFIYITYTRLRTIFSLPLPTYFQTWVLEDTLSLQCQPLALHLRAIISGQVVLIPRWLATTQPRTEMAMDHIIVFHKTQARSILAQSPQSQIPKMTTAIPKPPHKREYDRREVNVDKDSGPQQLKAFQTHDHINVLAGFLLGS